MNYIIIAKNPWLERETKIPIHDTKMTTIQATLNAFLHKHEILLHRTAYRWSDTEGKFSIVNIDNGALIASCTIQNVGTKV